MKSLKLRGDSLIEVMIAAAVLAIGISGILLALIYASNNSGDARRMMEASSLGLSTADEITAGGAATLTAGAFSLDAGGTNGAFTRDVVITNQNFSLPDGGGTLGGFLVQINVGYRDAIRRQRTQRYETVVTPLF
jgi:Tfp pilus assembly protein PilV